MDTKRIQQLAGILTEGDWKPTKSASMSKLDHYVNDLPNMFAEISKDARRLLEAAYDGDFKSADDLAKLIDLIASALTFGSRTNKK